MEAFFDKVSIEAVAAYWDARPCNIRHSDKEIGTRAYFDEVEARKYFVEPHIPGFAEFARWRGRKVLELGCGIGTDTINFARAGAVVTAIDLSRKSLEVAQGRAELFGLSDHIRFFQADGEGLTGVVPVEPHDVVYSFGVIHHTPHPDAVLTELRRYLAPGGTLKLMVYNRRSWKVLWIVLSYGRGRFWRWQELVARHSEAQTGCPVTYVYSAAEMSRMVAAHGFRVRSFAIDHIFSYRIEDYVHYRYVREWYLRWMPQSLFRWFERRFGWHLMITAEAV
jgi:2-polyprenyl-3-methyl-5-hydroxy-6-metoxy-1,4-benzoquinol methylase